MLVFDPILHSYKNEFTGEVYTSATSLIHKFKKPFDSDSAARRIAEREGTTKEEVQERWKKDNDKSKDYGTELHSVIETYLKTGTFKPEYTTFVQAYLDLDVIDRRKNELLIEHQVYSHEHRLAGTADLIRIDKNGGFSIFDLKTNKKFSFFNQYNEYLLYPLDHLTASEYSIYSLQLSLYAFMFQNITGRRLNTLGVMHYDRNTEKFYYYPMSFMKYEILTMLKHYEIHRNNYTK